jgi:large subunit ribosomal protein L15
MQSNTLKPANARMTSMRVGRGGKRGKTSGRGTKGQDARAGHKKRPEIRDTIKKLPKRRGYGKNRSRTVRNVAAYAPVNISILEAQFNTGDTVTMLTLNQKGIAQSRGGHLIPVKVLGTGAISKKLSLSGILTSASAKAAIEAAGGSVL